MTGVLVAHSADQVLFCNRGLLRVQCLAHLYLVRSKEAVDFMTLGFHDMRFFELAAGSPSAARGACSETSALL